MTLFKWGRFTSAAGLRLDWKIECDSLTPEDWDCIATVGMNSLPPYGDVFGVPTGGLQLAEAMELGITPGAKRALIVDDVWTTGRSMLEFADDHNIEAWIGYVAFARAILPPDIYAFCTINGERNDQYNTRYSTQLRVVK